MSQYKDYGWGESESEAHGCLQPVLEQMLIGDWQRTILDLGCGNGVLACRLMEQGYDVYGLDASESCIAVANARQPGLFFVQGINTGALPDALIGIYFNAVITTEVIEHLYVLRTYIALA